MTELINSSSDRLFYDIFILSSKDGFQLEGDEMKFNDLVAGLLNNKELMKEYGMSKVFNVRKNNFHDIVWSEFRKFYCRRLQ